MKNGKIPADWQAIEDRLREMGIDKIDLKEVAIDAIDKKVSWGNQVHDPEPRRGYPMTLDEARLVVLRRQPGPCECGNEERRCHVAADDVQTAAVIFMEEVERLRRGARVRCDLFCEQDEDGEARHACTCLVPEIER